MKIWGLLWSRPLGRNQVRIQWPRMLLLRWSKSLMNGTHLKKPSLTVCFLVHILLSPSWIQNPNITFVRTQTHRNAIAVHLILSNDCFISWDFRKIIGNVHIMTLKLFTHSERATSKACLFYQNPPMKNYLNNDLFFISIYTSYLTWAQSETKENISHYYNYVIWFDILSYSWMNRWVMIIISQLLLTP